MRRALTHIAPIRALVVTFALSLFIGNARARSGSSQVGGWGAVHGDGAIPSLKRLKNRARSGGDPESVPPLAAIVSVRTTPGDAEDSLKAFEFGAFVFTALLSWGSLGSTSDNRGLHLSYTRHFYRRCAQSHLPPSTFGKLLQEK